MVKKINKEPRISINKLGEYLVSKANRQRLILRDQKFPKDYITSYYKEAAEAISLFIADNMQDFSILEKRKLILEQKPTSSIQNVTRISKNINAIDNFLNMIDDIDFMGADLRLGDVSGHIKIKGVKVSVKPDIILTGNGTKGKKLVGGVKLHFNETHPLNVEAGGYISAALQIYCRNNLAHEGLPYPKYCMTIDIGSNKVYSGVQAIAKREKDIEAACEQIYNLWSSVRE
ncbi:MAG: hypothetical protein R3D71_05800 [Rickettsiales bacterium]